MTIRSQSGGQSQVVSRAQSAESQAEDLQVRGRKLLALAAERPLVSPALLGLPKASLDALGGGLLEGALLLAQRAGGAAKDGAEKGPPKGPGKTDAGE